MLFSTKNIFPYTLRYIVAQTEIYQKKIMKKYVTKYEKSCAHFQAFLKICNTRRREIWFQAEIILIKEIQFMYLGI